MHMSKRPAGSEKAPQDQAAEPGTDNITISPAQSPQMRKPGDQITIMQDRPLFYFASDPQVPILYSSSLGSAMADWIHEQFSLGYYSVGEARALQNIIVELRNTQVGVILMRVKDPMSIWNAFQGMVERTLGVKVDWWPFQPYMRPVSLGKMRLSWYCNCGDPRWAVVPSSFANKLNDLSSGNAPQPSKENASRSDVSSLNKSSMNDHSGMRSRSQNMGPASESGLPRSAVEHQSPPSVQTSRYQPHAFLVVFNSSIFGNTHHLAQTDVHKMNDQEFFTWLRNSYHSQRGIFAIWFGLFRFSHCEFFRFRRFDGYEYAPLLPEYPDDDQPFYHFAPKPMRPRPPMVPHEFNHWFYKDTWSKCLQRLCSKQRHRERKMRLCFPLGSKYVIEDKIPKRETALEEGVPMCEDFWGLYVVERRSIFRLGAYSLLFLSPSIYFFFAWLFQWGHLSDLQNASVPIMLSLAPLATFWGFILSTSPRFNSIYSDSPDLRSSDFWWEAM